MKLYRILSVSVVHIVLAFAAIVCSQKIVAQQTVLYPAGGERLQHDVPVSIRWSVLPEKDDVPYIVSVWSPKSFSWSEVARVAGKCTSYVWSPNIVLADGYRIRVNRGAQSILSKGVFSVVSQTQNRQPDTRNSFVSISDSRLVRYYSDARFLPIGHSSIECKINVGENTSVFAEVSVYNSSGVLLHTPMQLLINGSMFTLPLKFEVPMLYFVSIRTPEMLIVVPCFVG